MDFWDFLGSRHEQLLADALQHASAVFQCMVAATLIGVLIGVVTYRSEWAGNLATLSTSTILTIPSLAMIGLLIPVLGLGVPPTVTALTLYGLLPIVRNSIVGLRGWTRRWWTPPRASGCHVRRGCCGWNCRWPGRRS